MSLDRNTIVDAALDLLDEVGLEEFTTRRLGAALDISGPSLYWHFSNKSEILDSMAERILEDTLPPPDFTSNPFDWAAWLEDGARSIRAAALSRRDGAQLLSRLTASSPDYIKAWETNVECLQRSGMSAKEAAMTLSCLARFAVGWALYEQAAANGEQRAKPMQAGFDFGLSTFIAGLKARLRMTAATDAAAVG
jgi:TetR/AcrR family tetracycline transcriptional repressor